MVRLLVTVFLVVSLSTSSWACFILFLNDGSQILVGNHEDWFATNSGVKVNAPSAGKYGSVIFTFMDEGWAQGGMNEKGLFFDAAHTPFMEVNFASDRKEFNGYIWQSILDKCATVDEALAFIERYKIPELSEAHVMLADSTGKAVIVGVENGKPQLRFFEKDFLMQTNFNPWHPELSNENFCPRYRKAEQMIGNNPSATVENMLSILTQTHQDELTVYSNIYDLKNRIIYVYDRRNFGNRIKLDIKNLFPYDQCMVAIEKLVNMEMAFERCFDERPFTISGTVVDGESNTPVPFANIGLANKNVGTLSDPDGSFTISIPYALRKDSVLFSSIGYDRNKIPVGDKSDIVVRLNPNSTVLDEVVVESKKGWAKVSRLGWMGGKEGVLPFDTISGGGVVAMLVEAPAPSYFIEKLQVRLMYNSKDTSRLRLHFYEWDSVAQQPGEELLTKEIILKDTKRFGWMRFDLSEYGISLNRKKFLVGFGWIDDQKTRTGLYHGFKAWEEWKKEQYVAGNENVEKVESTGENGETIVSYKFHGNMMKWPGFSELPPFTGLMVEKGKHEKTVAFRTFQRKTSFGKWEELESTLNAVVTVSYYD